MQFPTIRQFGGGLLSRVSTTSSRDVHVPDDGPDDDATSTAACRLVASLGAQSVVLAISPPTRGRSGTFPRSAASDLVNGVGREPYPPVEVVAIQ